MRGSIFKSINISLLMLLSVTIFLNATCVPVYASKPHISKLEASYLTVYPQSTTQITCTAESSNGDNLIYKWSCIEGIFEGSGSTVIWKAPNKYGDFHIMVAVEDSKGATDQATLTISVVVNENQPYCPSCGKR